MCCARCMKNNKCACSVKSIVSDYKDNYKVAQYVSWCICLLELTKPDVPFSFKTIRYLQQLIFTS